MAKFKKVIKVGDIISIAQVHSGELTAYQVIFSDGYFYTIYPGEKIEFKAHDLHLTLSFRTKKIK